MLPILAAASAPPPNFLFILGDDIGWADFSYNNGTARTPHIKAWTESPGTVVVLPLRGARGVGCAAVGSHVTSEIAVASALIFAMRTTMVPATPLALAVAFLALAITMRLMMCIVVLFWSLPRSLSVAHRSRFAHGAGRHRSGVEIAAGFGIRIDSRNQN